MPRTLSAVREELASVVAIPATPFTIDGRLDLDSYGKLIHRLSEAGIDVITANGNTGEFYSLAADEHRITLMAAVEAMADRGLVVAGIGFDVATAIEMGRFAEAAGAAAVMVHQPVHPYQSDRGWVIYHRAIAAALPTLAVVPYIRNSSVTARMLRDVIDECPNLVGVKYAAADVTLFAGIVGELAGYDIAWICGLAEPWAPFFWLAGARGFTSGLANVHAQLSLQMLRCLQGGEYEEAMRLWRLAKPFEDLRARRSSANNVPVVKEALSQMAVCERTVRAPLVELEAPERREVSDILATWAVSPVVGGKEP
jgi:4-hydroxy-tetrahydrodipicolinate synthase